MRRKFAIEKIAACMLLLITIASCKKESSLSIGEKENETLSLAQRVKNLPDITLYALEGGGTRIDKISTKLRQILNSVSITGLSTGDFIAAIDFRPATGQMYGISSSSRLYIINPGTGAARMIGAGPITPALSGSVAAFDFNPTVDRIRLISATGQNLRLNPETATVAATDLDINGVAGAMVTSAAYTNNMAGAATTILYDLDVTTQKLYKQLPPNDGKLVEVGPLKLKISGEGGFDITPGDLVGLGLYMVNNIPTLFSVDLNSGEAATILRFEGKIYTGIAIPTKPVAYAADLAGNLLIFDPSRLSSMVSKPFTGLMTGEMIMGIDFRPLNGQLYGLTNNSRIVTINTASGACALVGTLSTALSGTDFGFDFNPVVDRIRIISNTGQNLRYNPNDPSLPVLVDGNLNPGMPAITAAAYANNFAGTTSTMLFDIDVDTDKLYLQNPPNSGGLVEIGSLGINVSATNGFDIGGTSGTAWAILNTGERNGLYTINTASGAATFKSAFPVSVNGFTVGLGF